MTEKAKELVKDIQGLISLPEVVQKVNELVNSEHSSVSEMAEVISHDPGLATRILQIANSPMYGSSREVDTISRAVTLLGTKQIRDLVLTTSATKVFDGIPNEVISVEDFWHHSVYCALLARSLAKQSKKADPETLFTAGLLHDIGHLVMFYKCPALSHSAILLTVQGDANKSLVEAEQEVMGFDHGDVGAELANHWHLPELIVECIFCHHHPETAKNHLVAVAHIVIANTVASLPYVDDLETTALAKIEPFVWEAAGLDFAKVEQSIAEVSDQLSETIAALFGDAAA